jgi:hypothetical protein
MPHDWSGGFTTTQPVAIVPNNNHDSKHKPQVSYSSGQNADNTKTETNDAKKQ